MTYHAALQIIGSDTENLSGENPEYERGQLELVADLYARPGIERGVRVEEVSQDVLALARIEATY